MGPACQSAAFILLAADGAPVDIGAGGIFVVSGRHTNLQPTAVDALLRYHTRGPKARDVVTPRHDSVKLDSIRFVSGLKGRPRPAIGLTTPERPIALYDVLFALQIFLAVDFTLGIAIVQLFERRRAAVILARLARVNIVTATIAASTSSHRTPRGSRRRPSPNSDQTCSRRLACASHIPAAREAERARAIDWQSSALARSFRQLSQFGARSVPEFLPSQKCSATKTTAIPAAA